MRTLDENRRDHPRFGAWKAFLRTLAAACIVLAASGRSGGAQPRNARSPAEVAAVFAAMQSSASRLTSIQYESTSVLSMFRDGKPPEAVQSTIDFTLKDIKYRVSVEIESGSGRAPIDQIHAYDGKKHQCFTRKAGTLELISTPSKSPYLHPPLILVPYAFIFDAGDRPDFPTLINHNAWGELAGNATLQPRSTIDGHECEVIAFTKKLGMAETLFTVFSAIDLEYFPLRWESSADWNKSTLAVVSYEIFDTRNGRVVVPTEVHGRSVDADGQVRQISEMKIITETLQVNHDIPDEFFTLDAGLDGDLAGTKVWVQIDGDTGEIVRYGSPATGNTSRTRYLWILSSLTLLLSAAAAWVTWNRRQKTPR